MNSEHEKQQQETTQYQFWYVEWKSPHRGWIPAYKQYHDARARMQVATAVSAAKRILHDYTKEHPDEDFRLVRSLGAMVEDFRDKRFGLEDEQNDK